MTIKAVENIKSQADSNLYLVDAQVSAEDCATIVEEAQSIHKQMDLGHSILYHLKHPMLGALVVLNSSLGASAVMALDAV